MQTEPEQWAVDLATDIDGAASDYEDAFDVEAAALTIQRAFEERERKLREALSWYADQMCEGICEGHDPKMCALIGPDNCAGCPAVIALRRPPMLSEAMKAEGWIEWDGGPCPINAWQPVTIMRRDGKTARHPDSRFLDWRPYEAYAHTDIIAYKPEATHD